VKPLFLRLAISCSLRAVVMYHRPPYISTRRFVRCQGVDVVQFSERLREIRASKKQTQKALAELLGVSERAYQHYEAGTREPNIASLIALADYFDVSLDYLVGRSDDPQK
jgi:DNA-binding XRE family transcriptional regulator